MDVWWVLFHLFQEYSILGVCLWEILAWGVKPWPQVPNADVITQIEAGARPLCPDDCPLALYNFMERSIWNLKPEKRPTVTQIVTVGFKIILLIQFYQLERQE